MNRQLNPLYKFHKNPYLMMGLFMFVGAGLRLYWLNSRSLWLDEAKLYWIAQGTIHDVIRQNAEINSAPLLYAILIHIVSGINASEGALRSVSFLAGILSIPGVYWLARQFVGQVPAYLASFLVTISLNMVLYSQELREYTLTFLLACLIFTGFTFFIRRPSWKLAAFVALVFGLGIITQYGLALLVLSLNLIFISTLIIRLKDGQPVREGFILWTGAQLFVLATIVVVYVTSLKTQFQQNGFARETYLANGYWQGSFSSALRLLVINTNDIIEFAFTHPSLLYFFFGLGLLYAFQDRKLRIAIFMLVIPMFIALISGFLRLYPYIGMRQNIYLTPMIFVVTALGAEYLINIRFENIKALSGSTLILIAVLSFTATSFKDIKAIYLGNGIENIRQITIADTRPVIEVLSNSYQEGDHIYIGCRAAPAFRYTYRENQDQWIIREGESIDDYISQVEQILKKPGRVWMVFSACYANDGEMEAVIASASTMRKVEAVDLREGAWLYLAK